MTALPRFADTAVLVTLDADPLGPGPDQIRLGSDFAKKRTVSLRPDNFLRLYAIEPSWTLTGANADARLALTPELIRNVAIEIANTLGANITSGYLPEEARRFASAAARDILSKRGNAMVLAGLGQPAEVHALCHWINDQLQAPLDLIEPVDPFPSTHAESLRNFVNELNSGETETLFIIDTNPAYSAPADSRISEAIEKASFSAHIGLCDDETAALCKWRLPLSHSLESWSDLRSFDGTAAVVQPLIRPLYDTRSAHELVALLESGLSTSSYDLVRDTWRQRFPQDFEKSWRRWLNDGVIANTAQQRTQMTRANLPSIAAASAAGNFSLVIRPDPSIWDGRFSNNAWLQECPKPLTKEVWGNSLDMSPKDAAACRLEDGDIVRLTSGPSAIEAPVHVHPGQADGVIAATLGYGRSRAGSIGNNIGFDAYKLQRLDAPWAIQGVNVSKTGQRLDILTTQKHFGLDSDENDILPKFSITDLSQHGVNLTKKEPSPTLLPDWRYHSYKWAMVIDNTSCIGCNACVLACQSENNVPVVGPQEVAVGRDMHWLRIDAYYTKKEDKLRGFQPVPCMHCEKAPCEPVCPVAASVHDSEGLNVQVYNRCIGTRFCQSNCPYKVRRFNFFGYATDEAYGNLSALVMQAHFNPDVTVRDRGVMEKCTYCVQRISRARRAAEKEDRTIRDGEVVTACQAACPTRAIVFGDLNDGSSQVNALRREPHHYALLDHLDTRPRTTYLARITNPNPALGEGDT